MLKSKETNDLQLENIPSIDTIFEVLIFPKFIFVTEWHPEKIWDINNKSGVSKLLKSIDLIFSQFKNIWPIFSIFCVLKLLKLTDSNDMQFLNI